MAERVIITIRSLLKKTIFVKGKADWITEIPSVKKQYNKIIHQNIKETPVKASLEKNEEEVSSNLKDGRKKFQSKFKLGQLVRTADIKKVFSKVDSTNYSYKFYTITEVNIPSYRINYLTEICKEFL